MAERRNITVFEGTDKLLSYTHNGGSSDITGWTIAFSLKASYDDPEPILTIPAVVTNEAAGYFEITLTVAHTNRTPGQYVYDVRRTNAGSEDTLAYGYFKIEPGVKR